MMPEPSLPAFWPVSVDYRGHTPVSGDHVAIPLTVWSDICFALGWASNSDNPRVIQATKSVGRRFPIVRFGTADNAGATDD